ncbi:CAP domain-containing protein, partial [Pedobacter sp.]|uniref:CAP domain-containing protein n=1 Tax=Pedobacter sp. TaxID=1411316 RepID=UPI003D7FF348
SMKLIIPILILLTLYTTAQTVAAPSVTVLTVDSQRFNDKTESWSQKELSLANTAKDCPYLSIEEQQIIFYMNLIRMDGEKFFKTYFKTFVKAHNERMKQYSNYNELKINEYDRYYRGLEMDLKKVKNYGLFYPDETLTYVALQHGKEMNRKNSAGHASADGRSPQDRISKYYPNRAMAENLAFGFAKGLDNVCMLLLDKGVPDLGHRKNILNNTSGLNIVGVSIQRHPAYKYCATIDFVGIPDLKI